MTHQSTNDEDDRMRRLLEKSESDSESDSFEHLNERDREEQWAKTLNSGHCDDESIGKSAEEWSKIMNISPIKKRADSRTFCNKSAKSVGLSAPPSIGGFHPGLNVFSNPCFRFFDFHSLDIEKDFDYIGEGRSIVFDKADPIQLVMLLNPESVSTAILDQNDFRSVCSFLFYSLSTREDNEDGFEIYSGVLFNLFANYGYDWQISVKDVIAVILNLGGDDSLFLNENGFRLAMKSRIRIIEDLRRRNNDESPDYRIFSPDFLPKFLNVEKQSKTAINVKDFQQRSIKRFIGLLADIACHYESRLKLNNDIKEDWTPTLMLTYVMATIATDVNLVDDGDIKFKITLFFHSLIESFSEKQWTGDYKSENGFMEYKDKSALCDMAEAFLHAGHVAASTLKTWKNHPGYADHPRNVIFRSTLIPPSPRGRRLKKLVSILYFQYLIRSPIVYSIPDVTARDLKIVIEEHSDRIKALHNDHEVMLSLVRLADGVVGNEPGTDFNKEVKTNIESLKDYFNGYAKKLKDDITDKNPSHLKEVIHQVTYKWTLLLNGSSVIPSKITDFWIKCK